MDKMTTNKLIIWKIIALFLLVCLIVIIVLYSCGVGWKDKKNVLDNPDYKSILTLWEPESSIIKKLVPYINEITNKNSIDYIPVEDRIAVFDLDGTLFCETDPIYFESYMFAYRVLEDPDYKDKAEQQDIDIANEIRAANIHSFPESLEKRLCVRNAYVYKDMPLKDFYSYIKNYLNKDAPGYNNMKRGDAFYQPMLQVIDYLQKNEFTVFIVSGTDRFEVRTIIGGHINIPESQILGSSATVKASGQGNKDGLDYQFQKDDYIILGGNFTVKNVKMNKVYYIETEIGKKPVLSFGNSSGDTSMANYVVNDNQYESLAFMVCCDDLERENGDMKKANNMKKLCEENNWEPISMRDDWKTIYGDKVTRKI